MRGFAKRVQSGIFAATKSIYFMNQELNDGKAEAEGLSASENEHTEDCLIETETSGESNASSAAGEAAPTLRPAKSKSRTTNIPPLMPAGFAPAPSAPESAKKDKKASGKKGEAAPVEHIGALRSASVADEPTLPARQRRIRAHREPGFLRRHWWWMLLLVLLLAVAASLPWTLPEIERWNGEEEQPAPAAIDSSALHPAPHPAAVPDTAAQAALLDSLRNDSLRRAAERAYWRRRKAEEAARKAQAEEEQTLATPAAHTDSIK